MAFIIPFGFFESLIISFSIYNTLASWQAYINKVLGPLLNNTYIAFLDNILIWEDLDKEIRAHIFKALDYLCKEGLYYKLFKYYFKVNKVNFLKYLISYNKLYINPD